MSFLMDEQPSLNNYNTGTSPSYDIQEKPQLKQFLPPRKKNTNNVTNRLQAY